MGGVLPLLEAFVAFALTMAALTTVVSALVGTWHKLTRARAYGLRMQMVYLFRNEILPLVDDLATREGATPEVLALATELDEPGAASGQIVLPPLPPVGAVTGARDRAVAALRWLDVLEKRFWIRRAAASPRMAPLLLWAGGVESDDPNLGRANFTNRLAQFLVDTTLLPQVVDYPAGASGPRALAPDWARDPRLAMLRNGLGRSLWLVTGDRGGTRKPSNYLERFYRWRSLRFALDTLPLEEFRTRLADSEVGRILRGAFRSDAEFALWIDAQVKRFDVLGKAGSESFRRKSHIASYVAGFLLAFGANIDSLNLLSVYLQKPEITRRLVDQYERSGELPSVREDRLGAEALLPQSEKLATAEARMRAALADPRLGSLAPELKAELEDVAGELKESGREVRAAAVDAAALMLGVSQAFPVGWNLYPNCRRVGEDARCLKLAKPVPAPSGAVAMHPLKVAADKACAGTGLSPVCAWVGEALMPLRQWRAMVMDTASRDPSGFYRWFVGVLLTGFMLGLGTPFWVQVITAALYTRNLLRGANSSGTGAPAGPGQDPETRTAAAVPARPSALRILPN